MATIKHCHRHLSRSETGRSRYMTPLDTKSALNNRAVVRRDSQRSWSWLAGLLPRLMGCAWDHSAPPGSAQRLNLRTPRGLHVGRRHLYRPVALG